MRKGFWVLVWLGVGGIPAAVAGYGQINELKVDVVVAPDIKSITKNMIKDKANDLVAKHLTKVQLSKGAPQYFIDVTIGGFEEKTKENPEVFAFVLVRLTSYGDDEVDNFTKVYQQEWRYFKGNVSKIDDGINGLLKDFITGLSRKWK